LLVWAQSALAAILQPAQPPPEALGQPDRTGLILTVLLPLYAAIGETDLDVSLVAEPHPFVHHWNAVNDDDHFLRRVGVVIAFWPTEDLLPLGDRHADLDPIERRVVDWTSPG